MNRTLNHKLSGVALVGAALALALTGCSSSPNAAAAHDTTTMPPSTTVPPSTTAAAGPLSGTHAIDIVWSGMRPQEGVPCPAGLSGYCTHVTESGNDATLGEVTLDEYVSTPGQNSCSTADAQGTLSRSDAESSTLSYTGSGQFCWSTLVGTFNLTLTKGTGELAGVTGTLVAKVTPQATPEDEWKGQLTFHG